MPELSVKDMNVRLEAEFLFALTWSAGASLDHHDRDRFDSYLRKLYKGDDPDYPKLMKLTGIFPEGKGTCYDFVYGGAGRGRWSPWSDRIQKDYDVPHGTPFGRILVPTADTARYSTLLEMAMRVGHSVLFVGPTGVGKSVYVEKEKRREEGKREPTLRRAM